MILVIQTFLSYVIYCALASDLSKLDRYELDNVHYQIDIDQNIQPFSSIQSLKTNTISIKSSNGQLFACSFDSIQSMDKEMQPSMEENALFTLFTNSNNKDENFVSIPDKPSFNFTLIDSKVKQQMSNLNNSNSCLLKNNGWWTYEFCFGKLVNQYHLLANGSIEGQKTNLGNYSHDFDWLSVNETKKYPTRSDVLYHEQYFEDGSLCELTGKPRKTTVKLFCEERGLDRIEMISEIETCVYEIFVRTRSLCSVPNFSIRQISHDLRCSPVVSDRAYESYLARKESRTDNEKVSEEESKILSDIGQLTDINKELQQELDTSEKKLENLMAKTEEVKTDKNLDKLNSIIDETNTQISKNDEIFDKISKKLDNILDDFESGKIDAEKSPIVSETSEIFKDTDDLDVQEFEKKLKSKLKSKNVKIKIIKLDPNSIFGSNGFNSLISDILENSDDKAKLAKMNANYNQVYTEDYLGQSRYINDNLDDLLFDHETENNNLVIY